MPVSSAWRPHSQVPATVSDTSSSKREAAIARREGRMAGMIVAARPRCSLNRPALATSALGFNMSRVRAAEPVRMASPTPPDLKGLQYLSQEERNARRPTLPPGEGFWVFGYGSLMRSEEHTSELQSLMRSSYAVFCLKKKKTINHVQL